MNENFSCGHLNRIWKLFLDKNLNEKAGKRENQSQMWRVIVYRKRLTDIRLLSEIILNGLEYYQRIFESH